MRASNLTQGTSNLEESELLGQRAGRHRLRATARDRGKLGAGLQRGPRRGGLDLRAASQHGPHRARHGGALVAGDHLEPRRPVRRRRTGDPAAGRRQRPHPRPAARCRRPGARQGPHLLDRLPRVPGGRRRPDAGPAEPALRDRRHRSLRLRDRPGRPRGPRRRGDRHGFLPPEEIGHHLRTGAAIGAAEPG